MIKPIFTAAAWAVATSMAQAATSFAGFGPFTWRITDLAPDDGIAPSFHVYGPGDPRMFFDEFTFRDFRGNEVFHDTTGPATITLTRDRNDNVVGVSGRTSGPNAAWFELLEARSVPDYFLTPHTQLTLTVPYTLSYDARDGFARAALNMTSFLAVGSRDPQAAGELTLFMQQSSAGDSHDSIEDNRSIGDFVSQFVMTLKNTTPLGGVVGFFSQFISSGRSAAVGCMRSLRR